MNILFMMSGSIACAKATGLISQWRKEGHNLKVVCSKNAYQFIGKATLEGLSGGCVYDDTYADGEMMQHIHLSRWADQVILCPATANVINKLSAGIADDMLTTTWIAAQTLQKPMFIVPAMNSMMWKYPATQESTAKLTSWGVTIVPPESGELACGEEGNGRMLSVDQIDRYFFSSNVNKARTDVKRILITAGGTREYIDGVRYIGNLSSGKTGAQIADYFHQHKHEVTWLGAKDAIKPTNAVNSIRFETFDDLSDALRKELNKNAYDAVIHAAAVSDYSIEDLSIGEQTTEVSRHSKLPTANSVNIKLKKNPKLIKQLKTWSVNKNIQIIGFKLTNSTDINQRMLAVKKLIEQSEIPMVAHNDLTQITESAHPFQLHFSSGGKVSCENVVELCSQISIQLENVA